MGKYALIFFTYVATEVSKGVPLTHDMLAYKLWTLSVECKWTRHDHTGTGKHNKEDIQAKLGPDEPVHEKVRLDRANAEGDKGSHAISTDVGQTIKDGRCNKPNAIISQAVYKNSASDPVPVSPNARNREGHVMPGNMTDAYDQGVWGSASIGLLSRLRSVVYLTENIYQTPCSSLMEGNNSRQ